MDDTPIEGTSFSEDELQDLISAALELMDQGLEPPLEELCGRRPELVLAVKRALEVSRQLPALQRNVGGRDALLGRVLVGRYRLEARLGSGAMGVVYRGHDLDLERSVAVKILRSSFLDDSEAEQRFEREAEVMASIRHPTVVTVYDRGRTEQGDAFLVMELLEGAPLSELLSRFASQGAASLREDTGWIAEALGSKELDDASYLRTVVSWAADLAGGLAAAHELGICHRDVKPSNIFVRKSGAVVLLDFGIAARTDRGTLRQDSGALGTPAYMAPEALEEEPEASPSLDVYGLAATLFHMLTRTAPYRGTPSQILAQLATVEPPRASRLRPGLPRDLQAILDCGMSRTPAKRYATAAGFESDLRAFLDYRPVSARPVTALARFVRRVRRSPAALAAAAVIAIGLLALAGTRLHALRTAERAAEHLEVWRLVPPNLTVSGMASRVWPAGPDRDAIFATLDRAAELCADPLPTLLVRSSFRLDHGDPKGAWRDMRRIADSVATPYARGLAARYAELPAEASSALDLRLDDLPPPRGYLDAYLRGYHLMRLGDYEEGARVLGIDGLEKYPPAQELAITAMTLPFSRLPREERREQAHAMYERAVRLEETIGARTATTAYLLGTALVHQEQYGRAIEVLRDGVELCPRSFGLRTNASRAAWRVELLEEARANAEAAIELRPKDVKPFDTLVRILLTEREFDAALVVVGRAPFGDRPTDRQQRLVLEAQVETERALHRWVAGEHELARASAAVALERFDGARALGDLEETSEETICRALDEGEPRRAFVGVARLLEADPLRWRRLQIVLEWMPDDLDSAESAALARYVRALRDNLANQEEVTQRERQD